MSVKNQKRDIKIVFIPGNGNSTTDDNWFPGIKSELQSQGFDVTSTTFPDPDLARESYWLPFLRDALKVDEKTILIGHSSGAIAAMRFAEQYRTLGSVLVGAYHNDLGMEKEKSSGYFDRPWNWKKIRQNQNWISLFASEDDPWIPIEQPRYIHACLNCEYHEYKNQGHFGPDRIKNDFPEIVISILNNLAEVKMPQYKIRNATDQDAHQIADLIFDIWINEYHFQVSPEDYPDLQKIEAHYQNQGGAFWVAVKNQKIIGSIACSCLCESTFVLKRMFVKRENRESGVAQALLDHLLKDFSSGTVLYLSTKEDLAVAAKKFYLRNGFEVVSKNVLPKKFPMFYEDDLFMRKTIL